MEQVGFGRKKEKRNILKFPLYKWERICYNKARSECPTARWCSRLARQPVTLEVDGSSPFRVAKKIPPHIGAGFLFRNKGDSVETKPF